MNYYAFHIGDYASATRHLSWDEDLAYRRMLDAYYMREGDLPAKPQRPRTIRREHMSLVKPFRAAGTNYRPGRLLDLGHDQCRYTIRDTTMCGDKVCRLGGSWCGYHQHVVRFGSKVEAAE